MEQLAVVQTLPDEEPESTSEVGPLRDGTLVVRARAGDTTAFELLMRRHNQRLYRVVRGVLRDEAEIEDVMQQAYVSAFAHLDQFEGTAAWSTWLCRIAFNEALARCRQRGRFVSMDDLSETALLPRWQSDPERQASERELAALVEAAVDDLPDIYRTVLLMREIEGMSTGETAALLDVGEDVVKTRLHRARSALRATVEEQIGFELESAFAFGNQRCDRVVACVIARLAYDGAVPVSG